MRTKFIAILLTTVGVPAIVATPAAAQEATSPTRDASMAADEYDGEIVVTATKREQSLLEVPASISAVSGETLETKSVVEIRDINGLLPGLQVNPNNNSVSITIRGVGHTLYSPAAENSSAFHLDGVYLARPASTLSAFFDVERIEVLRGPQGTLYGRNATGGAINVISREPGSSPNGYLSLTYGNYDKVKAEGAVGGPIAGDWLKVRVGGYVHRRDGFGTNLTTGNDVDALEEYGGKATIAAELSDRFSLTLRGAYTHIDDSYGLYHFGGVVRRPFPGSQPLSILLGGAPSPDIRDTNSRVDNKRYADIVTLSATAEYEIANGFSIKSITGYNETTNRWQTTATATDVPVQDPLTSDARSDQWSQELQLTYQNDNLFVLLGGYYFDEKISSRINLPLYLGTGLPEFGIPPILPAPFGQFLQQAELGARSKAIFANVDWDASDRLHFSIGARYSHDRKANRGSQIGVFPDFDNYPVDGIERVDLVRTSNSFTPKASARFDISDDVNVYASVSRGFKAGEFISGTNQYAQPEKVWAYEAGIKGRVFDRTLQFSLSGFYYDYSDLQVQRLFGPETFIENVPTSTLKGIEGEFTWRLPAGFTLDGNFTYLSTRNGGFLTQDPNIPGRPTVNLKGRRFAFAPDFTANLGLEKRFDIGGRQGKLRFDFQHTSDTYLDIFESKEAGFRPAYQLYNASYTQDIAERLSVMFWAKNLSDETVILNTNVTAPPNVIVPTAGLPFPPYPTASIQLVNLAEPRTFGATLRFEW